jgi:hypothetical protein
MLLPLTVIALGAVDLILFLESSWGFLIQLWGGQRVPLALRSTIMSIHNDRQLTQKETRQSIYGQETIAAYEASQAVSASAAASASKA